MKTNVIKAIKSILMKFPPIAFENNATQAAISPESLYKRYKAHADLKINEGKMGRLRIAPKNLWLNISENCNLKCVGCYTEDKFKKSYSDIEEVRRAIQFDGKVEEISFTTNEALLNPQFCDIIDLCRETHPEAKLWIITNGTIPIKGRYKSAISKLNKVGLSIDGATKETFESIRIGARFEDFIENTKEIIKIKKETGFPKEITFAFTATATNLHELIDVVRLGYNLGVTDIWAQSMEAKGQIIEARIADILIDNLDPEYRTKLIDEAKAEATRLGLAFYNSEGLYPPPAILKRLKLRLKVEKLSQNLCKSKCVNILGSSQYKFRNSVISLWYDRVVISQLLSLGF